MPSKRLIGGKVIPIRVAAILLLTTVIHSQHKLSIGLEWFIRVSTNSSSAGLVIAGPTKHNR